jgi:NAD(P)-dependent dehydrogenase (short-subunit alcohol dehydrogenase family)
VDGVELTIPPSLFDLSGRTVVVTGGAGPLGLVLSQALADQGARVVIVDRIQELVREALTKLRAGVEHVGIVADLLHPDALATVAADVEALGACDVLVHNAAFTGTSGVAGYAVPFERQTDEAFDLATRLNLTVPFSLTRRLAPLLRANGRGSVINVSSIYGLVGPNMGLYAGTQMGNPAAYAATKGGLAQLTRYLSTVLAPDIRVNAFAPGGIERGQHAEFVERYVGLTPMGRMATENDFGGVVTWLAGDASAYVTGQVIAVDGGWTAW